MTSWIADSLQTLSNYFGNEEDEEEALEGDKLATTGSSRKKRKDSTTTSHRSSEDKHEDDAESKTRSYARAKRQKSGSVVLATAKLTNRKGGDPGSKVLATKTAETTAESPECHTEDQQQL